jgi:hypothetical protein
MGRAVITSPARLKRTPSNRLRIPSDADQRSEVMAITIPN